MDAKIDLKRINGYQDLVKPGTSGLNRNSGTGVSFRETLDRFDTQGGVKNFNPTTGSAVADPLKFSNHAIERMQSRGVKFNPEDIQRLGDAVQKARAKGSKDSLVLMNDNAVIVSVKNNTVVTVVDKTSLKENVFTNIDSTIVI
jgi:flagellar operon protein